MRAPRFELGTSTLSGWRSNQLSYARRFTPTSTFFRADNRESNDTARAGALASVVRLVLLGPKTRRRMDERAVV